MIHLPYLSVLSFTGPDAGSFLHAQLSADILALEDGDSGFATYCTARGQVLGLLLLGRAEDGYLAIGSSELLPAMAQRLRMFVLRAQVQIELQQEMEVFGLLHSDPATPTGTLFSPADLSLRYLAATANSGAGQDSDQWKFAELSQGVTWLDAQTSEKYIPQMLGFETIGAVSFSKGCYPGQEIVARTRYLGKVKRTPLIVTVEGQCGIRNGSVLQINYGTESINGTLVDSAPAENENTLLFIVTRNMDGEKPASITYESSSFQVV
jgi:folate-binding protein YgfZ